jgi:hypothetical protein
MDESLEATVDPEPPTKMAGEFGASFSVMAGASQMTKLTPETYGIWSIKMRVLLQGAGLWPYVVAKTESVAKDGTAEQQKAGTIIATALGDEVISRLAFEDFEDGRVLWKTLADTFRKTGRREFIALHRQKSKMRFDPDEEDLEIFLSRYKKIKSDIRATGVKETEYLMDIIFLMATMPERFATTVQIWDTMKDNELTFDLATRMLRNENLRQKQEAEFRGETGKKDNVALTANGDKKAWKNRKKNDNTDEKFEGECNHCGTKGHKEKDCWKKHPEKIPEKIKKKMEAKKVKHSVEEKEDRYSNVAFAVGQKTIDEDWSIDSACSQHLTRERSLLFEYEPYDSPRSISGITGRLNIIREGKVKLLCLNENGLTQVTLSKVQYAPTATMNLLSVNQLESVKWTFAKGIVTGKLNGRSIMEGKYSRGQYLLTQKLENKANAVGKESLELIHARLGHLNLSSIRQLMDLSTGLRINKGETLGFCQPYVVAKAHRHPSRKIQELKKHPLELVHSDLCGPITPASTSGAKYLVTYKDDATRFTWDDFLARKEDFFQSFLRWKARVEKETGRKLKVFRSDGGGEYVSKEMENYLKDEGIAHETTPCSTSEMNGVAERMNRTAIEGGRALLNDADDDNPLPRSLWAEAVHCTNYLKNRSPTRRLAVTPFEALWGKKPDLSHLRKFGCEAWVHLPKDTRRKLDNKAEKGRFVGYGNTSSLYRILRGNKVTIHRDVIFNEVIKPPLAPLEIVDDEDVEFRSSNAEDSNAEDSNAEEEQRDSDNEKNEAITFESEEEDELPATVSVRKKKEKRPLPPPRIQPTRNKQRPTRYANAVRFNLPKDYQEAKQHEERQEWIKAIQKEIQSISENRTFEEVQDVGQPRLRSR